MKTHIISTLSFSFALTVAACGEAPNAVQSVEESPTLTAMAALGAEPSLSAMAPEDAARFLQTVQHDDLTVRTVATFQGDRFEFTATPVAVWSKGNGASLATVIQRGFRDGKGVIIATLLDSKGAPISVLSVEGQGDGIVTTEHGPMGPQLIDPDALGLGAPPSGVATRSGALAGWNETNPGTECTILYGLVNTGATIADGMCLVDAGFVCGFLYAFNEPARNECMAARLSSCAIASNQWQQTVCQ